MNENSCIETPAAPEWLSKLENRRELLKRGKLGHEAGAGAPCNECGDKCPGLDLHFWRKVCRNCKCRKDQHMCSDDDSSGWAQFEILGQIRSKPAFIKIKALASQPIQLEWVPPNVEPDVISDYMEKLGTKQIPVAGSEAALKRKQQLEFQVPPHDLDAAFCDNLTEVEANQLELYVQRVRDNCVGQGNVVRVGDVNHARLNQANEQKIMQLANSAYEDAVLGELLANEKLQEVLMPTYTNVEPKLLVAFTTPICEYNVAAFTDLSAGTKQILRGLNEQAVQSSLQHAAIYDKVFGLLEARNLDVSRDPRLGPLSDFHKAYKEDAQLRKEINSNFANTTLPTMLSTPARVNKASEFVFNSPLPLKHAAQTRTSAQMRQETPMRKLRLNNNNNNVQSVLQACGLPQQVDTTPDAFLADIFKSEALKHALQGNVKDPLILSTTPLPPFKSMQGIQAFAKQALKGLNLNERALKSVILNAPYYDAIYDNLAQKHIDFSQCKILQPLQQLRLELVKNPLLRAELHGWVHNETDSHNLLLETPKSILSNSNSSDSGFDSKPSTPRSGSSFNVNASPGKFASIPGIEDMQMYPAVKPSLPQMLEKLQLSSTPELKCVDCIMPISLGEVAVKAERADKGMAWHPACFKCHTCRELLADLVYFFYNGQVYCGRDLALKLKIPRCKACDELIFTKEYTAAEDASFHIKHFCCYHCDTPLAGHQYVPDEKTNMPLCLKCYEQYFAAACQSCKQFIGPAEKGVALGDIHWHGSCFNCAGEECAKSLIGGRFCVKLNMPFCSPNCMRSIIK